MPFTIDWLGAWRDPESKVHIHREIVSAFGNRTGTVNFEIAKAPDGRITITMGGTPYNESLILASGEEARKHGVIEKMVRQGLEGAEKGPRNAGAGA